VRNQFGHIADFLPFVFWVALGTGVFTAILLGVNLFVGSYLPAGLYRNSSS